jgi:drug/metabolite transporter (DMT)-like permease
MLWGMVFVAPLMLPDYPASVLTAGRYLAFGLLSIALARLDWHALQTLKRQDWIEAVKLSLIGNLLYYGLLAAAIQTSGAPVPTMLIGTLPVVIAVCSNLGDRSVAWMRLLAGPGTRFEMRDGFKATPIPTPRPGPLRKAWPPCPLH